MEEIMRQLQNHYVIRAALFISLFFLASPVSAMDKVVVGLNLPLSGPRQATGISTKEGAELLRQEFNDQGGVKIGEKTYPVEFIYGDNGSDPQGAVTATLQLATRDQVLAIVGPNASSNAIPAVGISQSFKVPMVSPTSTNPKTTKDRPYVFRACFLDNFQGEVMARFAIDQRGAEKAAVLYNISSAYTKGLAEFFRDAFENRKGKGSVVAFESYLSNEKDLSKHLDRIVQSGAQVLFIPQYAHEIPSIVRQARDHGWKGDIMGGDAWESTTLMEQCGELCHGLYFSSHFGAIGAKGKAGEFVKRYMQTTNHLPTGYAALGYDASKMVLTAIGKLDRLDDNLLLDREKIRANLAALKQFQGASGTLDMNEAGDPAKSAVVIRIDEKGQFAVDQTVAP